MPTKAKRPTHATRPIERKPVLVDLALQGGGSHGAFTWGVLDRLLEEPWLDIDGISGTSAGAMNAAVMVYGHQTGGRAGAREALEAFWRGVSDAARFSPFQRGPLDVLLGRWSLEFLADVCRHGSDVARGVAIRREPDGQESAARNSGGSHRFRSAGAVAHSPFHHRDQRPHGPGQGVQERRGHARRAARLGLPPHDVPGDRDRRRGLLGRRLFRQSDAHHPRSRMQVARHHSRADQSDRAQRRAPHRIRHPQPPQ